MDKNKIQKDKQKNTQKEEYTYFDVEAMRRELNVGQNAWNQAVQLAESGKVTVEKVDTGYSGRSDIDTMIGSINGQVRIGQQAVPVALVFNKNRIIQKSCGAPGCRNYYSIISQYGDATFCIHEIALFYLLEKYLREKNPGDATDRLGNAILTVYQRRKAMSMLADAKSADENLTLEPRLQKDSYGLNLSFRAGNEKLYVVKNLTEFVRRVENRDEMEFSAKARLRMDIEHFTESGKQYYGFIQKAVEDALSRRQYAQERYSQYDPEEREIKSSIRLFGSLLDDFCELLGSGTLEYTEGTGREKRKGVLSCRDKKPDIRLTVRKYEDREGVFQGVQVTGSLPELIYGQRAAYYLDDRYLNRVDLDYINELKPLFIYENEGQLEFKVGRKRLSEFYYTLLPWLRGCCQVEEEDQDQIGGYVPPEVHFIFYLDVVDRDVVCRVEAVYGELTVSAMDLSEANKGNAVPEELRNSGREMEMLFYVRSFFPYMDTERDLFCCMEEEAAIYEVLEHGVSQLISLGEVRSTDRFRHLNIRRKPKVSLGVSVKSQIMNLTVSSEELSGEELLEALRSYQKKNKFYRLKNGDFLKLETESIELLSSLMEAMHLKPGEFVRGKMQIPAYRALYLDKMLEEKAGGEVSRDRYYKKLVKEFKTVADSDFEVPKSLHPIMRGYQAIGYKWLRTLDAYGFGGILADDMGLGKTLQAIAVLLAEKEEGRTGISLVVAPASLVYNWGEEFKRFAPQLKVCLVTGSQQERLEMLREYGNWDVLVTSYDLLKRDVAEYEPIAFAYEILDEAQFIKNHQTAAAQAVKVIESRTRYALTGTPIENRLSELWSIFDYLMPGFLYSYEAFKKELEQPIVKNDDREASGRLKRMTAPFILRRLKTDVLKDLPEKLEEVRYAAMEEKQRCIYDGQVLHMRELIARQSNENFQKNRMQVLAELTRIRQICCDPSLYLENYGGGSAKRDACMDLIRSAVEGEHKMLVFSQFASMLELLEGDLTAAGIAYYKITGATPKEKRIKMVKEFNQDGTPVFLISLKAGGTGLNLTGADVVIHYDPWWNVAVQNQATDRAHRIGQTKVVTVYRLIMKDTVEEKILQMQEMKQKLSDDILEGGTGGIGTMNRDELLELLR